MRQLRVVTTEQVSFRLTAAGLGARALAWLVDQAILLALRIALVYILIQIGVLSGAVAVSLFFVTDTAYFLYYEWRLGGQTPGKRALKLRVVSTSGASLSFQDVFIRNALRLVDNLPMLMVAGGVAAFLDPLGRRLGDLAAGTMVVREKVRDFQLPPADRDRPNSYKSDAACRRRILARATREDRDLALELMWRKDELRHEVREELFGKLSGEFRKRFSLPADASLTDEQSVMDVALLLCERDDD